MSINFINEINRIKSAKTELYNLLIQYDVDISISSLIDNYGAAFRALLQNNTQGSSISFYKCQHINQSNHTWDGYKANLISGVYQFDNNVTSGLVYTSIIPELSGIYTDNALVKIQYLYSGNNNSEDTEIISSYMLAAQNNNDSINSNLVEINSMMDQINQLNTQLDNIINESA